MNTNENKFNFWGYIGKLGVLVALIWGVIQIFDYFSGEDDYKVVTSGKISYYEVSPNQKKAFNDYKNYKSIIKTLVENKIPINSSDQNELLKCIEENNDRYRTVKDKYEFNLKYSDNTNIEEFNEMWTFSIKNKSNKPLEDISLELPFGGYYKVILPNNNIKNGTFSNKIEIEDLKPSYDAVIMCWRNSYFASINNVRDAHDQEKTRFTHKYGWFSINYPVEATGIYAWNKRNDDIPLFIFIFISITIIAIPFLYYVDKQEKKKKKAEAEEKEKEKSVVPTKTNNIKRKR